MMSPTTPTTRRESSLTTTTGAGTVTASTTSNCYDPDGNKTATVPGDSNTSGVATCGASSPYETSSSYQTGYSYDSLGRAGDQDRPRNDGSAERRGH